MHAGSNPHGPEILQDRTIRFRLWAPAVTHVDIEIDGEPNPVRMHSVGEGWHELVTDRAAPGSRYSFVLPNGMHVPDPASRHQPQGVHGPSEIIDTERWSWKDHGWNGRPWNESVIYELHIGAFTPEGTFRAAIDRLDHLVDLGVTAVEIMPVADFPGRRDWGYDGVFLYAPAAAYGRPEDFKALIEAAHEHSLSVLLDVVYNHFGPEGNYLSVYAPEFFTDKHHTPWGSAINYDQPGSRAVRDFIIQNALYWIQQYHVDGLRLDAVDAIKDDSSPHILEELSHQVSTESGARNIHLILENEKNEARWLQRDRGMNPCLYTAQWNDDVHHVLHTSITGEKSGYYVDYCGDTAKLGRALAEGFAFQGEFMPYRNRPRGEPSSHLPPPAFISFLQNHDQVGNRAFGDRIARIAPEEAVRAAAAVYLLLPQIPMIFMGEEWNAAQPFPFFCDFGPDLASAVREGRRNEFSRFPEFQDPKNRELIPDPQALETFLMSKLRWEDLSEAAHEKRLRWYRRILARRRESILPMIPGLKRGGRHELIGRGAVIVRWQTDRSELTLAANLSGVQVKGFASPPPWLIWREGAFIEKGRALEPWSVFWWTTPHSGDIQFREGYDV